MNNRSSSENSGGSSSAQIVPYSPQGTAIILNVMDANGNERIIGPAPDNSCSAYAVCGVCGIFCACPCAVTAILRSRESRALNAEGKHLEAHQNYHRSVQCTRYSLFIGILGFITSVVIIVVVVLQFSKPAGVKG